MAAESAAEGLACAAAAAGPREDEEHERHGGEAVEGGRGHGSVLTKRVTGGKGGGNVPPRRVS